MPGTDNEPEGRAPGRHPEFMGTASGQGRHGACPHTDRRRAHDPFGPGDWWSTGKWTWPRGGDNDSAANAVIVCMDGPVTIVRMIP